MPSPVRPSDFLDAVPSSSAGICEKFVKSFLRLPVLMYKLVNWMFNSDGTFSDAAKAELGGGGTAVALAAPVNVVASDGDFTNKVQISWSPVSGAAYYEVFRGTSSDSALLEDPIASPVTTSYDDTTMTQDTSYHYFVRAKNTASTSPFSTPDTGFSDTTGDGGGGVAGERWFNPSDTSWVVPAGVTTVEVRVWPGGGGGGGGLSSAAASGADWRNGGGGGSGGFRHVKNIPVTPAETITMLVGSGGAGGSLVGDGSSGGPSVLLRSGTQLVVAGGGGGGLRGAWDGGYGAGGSAGSVGSNSVGTVFASSAGNVGTASAGAAFPTPGTGGAAPDASVANAGGNGGGTYAVGSQGGDGGLYIKWPTT